MTTATKITLVRAALIPFIMFFYIMAEHVDAFFRWGKLVALALFVVAAATDALDGWVARKYNQVSDMGKLLDPIVDKLLTLSALALILTDSALRHEFNTMIPMWAAAIVMFVIIGRDYIISVVRNLAMQRGIVIPADGFGKAKSIALFIGLALFMFLAANFHLSNDVIPWGTALDVALYISWFVLGTSVVLSVVSCVNYCIGFARDSQEKDCKEPTDVLE